VDETGKPYSIAKPIAPIAAKAGETDILPLLREKNDDKYYSFDDTSASTGVNQIQLSFARPLNAKKAKLILRLKNSYWMDATYGKMTEGFGSYYNAFIQQQHSKPLSELKKWISDQQIPLEVALNTKTGLQHITDIATFGPLASRSIVVPIDLTNVNSDEIQLQLSTGFMFWELDYAAIDFSEEAGFSISTLKPAMATDETGRNVTGLLTAADGKYLEQPNIGNSVNIEFVSDKHKDRRKIETYILHAKGYYEHIRDYRTPLNLGFLEQFKKPNGLSRYSMQLYKAALNNPKQLFFSMR